jgi:hypothetical protein
VRAARSLQGRRVRRESGLLERGARLRGSSGECVRRRVDLARLHPERDLHEWHLRLRLARHRLPQLPSVRRVRGRNVQNAAFDLLLEHWNMHQRFVQLCVCEWRDV